MTAYYNEHDPFAAAWLRELIKAGYIAPGDVDERSIEDVSADDLQGFDQHHFFAGIGVWSHALRQAGWADDRPIWTASCPCQPFSTAGQGGGFADERHLWPALHWLIGQCRPDVVVGEQVASKDGLAWFDLVSSDMEAAGYACGAVDLCAAGFGAPHIRQRNYWMAHHHQRQPGARRGDAGQVRGLQEAQRQPEQCAVVPGRSGEPGDVVDTPSEQEGLPRRAREPGKAGGVGFLADALPTGRPEGRAGAGSGSASSSSPGGLAHHHHQRRDGRGLGAATSGRSEPEDDGVLGDNNNKGLAERPFAVVEPGALRIEGATLGASSLVRGRWAGADWIFCRDGKWRPVEPSTFPLAHGAPARVGRLRGYGNALCAPVAQGFIETVMDVLDV